MTFVVFSVASFYPIPWSYPRYADVISAAYNVQVEMLQLRAENERMQRTISQNGLRELQDPPLEDDADSFKKKLSIGDPTTFG